MVSHEQIEMEMDHSLENDLNQQTRTRANAYLKFILRSTPLSHLYINNQIEYNWLYESYDSYKIKC